MRRTVPSTRLPADDPPLGDLIHDLPANVPFVAPVALERQAGRPFRLRLGANESAFGISPKARAAMIDAMHRLTWYGDPESLELRNALGRRHGVPIISIVVGSGIDDLLGLTVRAFLDPGAVAVMSLGGYPTFGYHVAGYGGRIAYVPYYQGRNDLEGLVDAARRTSARLVYLANPDNPTGTWHEACAIQKVVDELPSKCVLVLDEAYVDFAPPDSVPWFDHRNPRVIRMRTFSKAHGLAGARIGYAITHPNTIAAFDKVRLHFGVNRLAQAGALASLGDEAFLEWVVAAVAVGRADYEELCRDLGISALPSATNFIAMDMGSRDAAVAVREALMEEMIFVRMPNAPTLDRFIRVTVGTPEERKQFADALQKTLRQVAPADH